MGASTRRMLAAYRDRGATALAHGHRGLKAPDATLEALGYYVVHLARTRYSGANHTHLGELPSEREGIDIGRTTLRRILVNAGLNSPRRRRPHKHRVRRQRMPREGMLIQLDGSYHPWLGDQVPPFTLLIAVDDANGTVVDALFCEKEVAYTYLLLIQDLVQSFGIPVALYVDQHGVFRHTPRSGLSGPATQFSRIMDELGIQMIFALSPQAKGRVDRTVGTFQGRLITELRLARPAASGKPTGCWNSLYRDTTGASGFPYNALSPPTGMWSWNYAWSRSCASSTAGRWPRQYGEVPAAYLAVAARAWAPQLCRRGCGGPGRVGRPARVRHEGRIINAQEAPPSPLFLSLSGSGLGLQRRHCLPDLLQPAFPEGQLLRQLITALVLALPAVFFLIHPLGPPQQLGHRSL